MKAKQFDEAATHLKQAAAMSRTLGRYFDKYDLAVELSLPLPTPAKQGIRTAERLSCLSACTGLMRLATNRQGA